MVLGPHVLATEAIGTNVFSTPFYFSPTCSPPHQDETYYDAYNKRFSELHGPMSFEPFRAQAEAFKSEVLYPHIGEVDEAEVVNALWIRNLTEAHYK
jgi:hypothetical protein